MKTVAEDLYTALKQDLDAAGFDPTRATSDMDPQEFAAYSLDKSMLSKYLDNDETTPAQNSAGLEKFLAANERNRVWQLPELNSRETEILESMRREIRAFCTALTDSTDYYRVMAAGRVSPGSSIGAECTSVYGKLYCSKVSCGNSVIERLWKGTHELLGDAQGLTSLGLYGTSIAPASKLFFVPKNVEVARVACTEPLASMFYQLGFGRMIEIGMRIAYHIDISNQAEVNRVLVRKTQYSTIDLSSASDLNSLSLCRYLFTDQFMAYLSVGRSTHTELPDGSLMELHMVSSMGNGYTFPLETLIFGAVVRAVYRYLRIPWSIGNVCIEDFKSVRAPTTYGVFGDDLIVAEEAYDLVVRMLDILGHVPNPKKSFKNGPFRESCGVDIFKGVDVRPVYIKALANPCDFCSAYNRLNEWSVKHSIELPRTIRVLLRNGPSYRRHRVPLWEEVTAGYRTASWIKHPYSRRFYKVWMERKSEYTLSSDGLTLQCGTDSLPYRAAAMLQACLYTTEQQGHIARRSQSGDVYVSYRSTHNWDYAPLGALHLGLKRAGLLKPASVSITDRKLAVMKRKWTLEAEPQQLVEQYPLFP